jgi:hypothetical protein
MIERIAVINRSTVVNATDGNKMVAAVNLQLRDDVCPAWGRAHIPVLYYTKDSHVPPNSAKVYLLNDSDQADALGYHTVTGSLPWAKVFVNTAIQQGLPILYSESLKNAATVSAILSHEVVELFINPFASLWADGPQIPEGNNYVYEICNPVEANFYQISINKAQGPISVSNFVYPEYFNQYAQLGGRFDHLKILSAPFSLSNNGYFMVKNAAGEITHVYSDSYSEKLEEANLPLS